jgi:hypothetical protein
MSNIITMMYDAVRFGGRFEMQPASISMQRKDSKNLKPTPLPENGEGMEM